MKCWRGNRRFKGKTPPFDESLNLPRGVVFLVQKALSKNPADRFANADEMARALGEYARTGDTGPRPVVTTAPVSAVGGTTRINPQFSPPQRQRPAPSRADGDSLLNRPPTATVERGTRQLPRTPVPPRASAVPVAPPDALTALLFILAFAAVAGLIPLCYAVVQLYL
jgi:hypothetical protein